MGWKHSEETKEKLRLLKLGKKHSPERVEQNRISHTGHKHSEETKLKMSLSHKGKKQTPEHRLKSIENNKKTRFNESIVGEKHPRWKGGLTPFHSIQRKNRLKKNGGSHTLDEWENLKAQYNWTCPYCKRSEPEIKLTKDHIIPVSKGGSDNIENIQPLCKSCNCKKYDKLIISV